MMTVVTVALATFTAYPKMSMAPVPDFEQFSKKFRRPGRTPVPKFYDFAHFLEFHHCGALFFWPLPNRVKNDKNGQKCVKIPKFC